MKNVRIIYILYSRIIFLLVLRIIFKTIKGIVLGGGTDNSHIAL